MIPINQTIDALESRRRVQEAALRLPDDEQAGRPPVYVAGVLGPDGGAVSIAIPAVVLVKDEPTTQEEIQP